MELLVGMDRMYGLLSEMYFWVLHFLLLFGVICPVLASARHVNHIKHYNEFFVSLTKLIGNILVYGSIITIN